MNDFYLNDRNAIIRLISEWLIYKRIIIAYDFDETVFDYHHLNHTYDDVIKLLQLCKEIGAYFILSTCCDDRKMPEILNYIKKNNIPLDIVNDNAPFIPFQERKIYYNIMLDDRAGLKSAYIILFVAAHVMKFNPNNLEEAKLYIEHVINKLDEK